MLVYCCASVADVVLTLKQHWMSALLELIPKSCKQVELFELTAINLCCILKACTWATHVNFEHDWIFLVRNGLCITQFANNDILQIHSVFFIQPLVANLDVAHFWTIVRVGIVGNKHCKAVPQKSIEQTIDCAMNYCVIV